MWSSPKLSKRMLIDNPQESMAGAEGFSSFIWSKRSGCVYLESQLQEGRPAGLNVLEVAALSCFSMEGKGQPVGKGACGPHRASVAVEHVSLEERDGCYAF